MDTMMIGPASSEVRFGDADDLLVLVEQLLVSVPVFSWYVQMDAPPDLVVGHGFILLGVVGPSVQEVVEVVRVDFKDLLPSWDLVDLPDLVSPTQGQVDQPCVGKGMVCRPSSLI
jgi:hypothetical protein